MLMLTGLFVTSETTLDHILIAPNDLLRALAVGMSICNVNCLLHDKNGSAPFARLPSIIAADADGQRPTLPRFPQSQRRKPNSTGTPDDGSDRQHR